LTSRVLLEAAAEEPSAWESGRWSKMVLPDSEGAVAGRWLLAYLASLELKTIAEVEAGG